MRLFEVILLALLAVNGLRIITRTGRNQRWLDLFFALALLLVLALHLLLEGQRWQMVPVYILSGIAVLWALLRFGKPSIINLAWPGWVMLILLLLFSLPPVLVPVPTLPVPDGPYPVGTTSFYWVDDNRTDPYDGSPLKTMVQVWYPAEQVDAYPFAPYLEGIEIGGPVIAQQFGLPSFTLNHIPLAHTNSHLNAPIAQAQEQYPVLVFSHGWTGFRTQTSFLMEELASQGFIVFSPDHTYGAALTVFPDGKVILNNPDALPSGVSDEEYDRAARILGQAWVGDLQFVLNQAEKLQSGKISSPLQGRLDLTRVGALGHSTGGGAAVEFCAVDTRCKAGLSLDAWLIPYERQIPANGLNVPFLFMQSEGWVAKRNPPLQQSLFENMKAPAYRVTIAGTKHYDFSDLPLLTPVAPLIGLKGPLPAHRTIQIIDAYSLAFFQWQLQGGDQVSLESLAPQFPEVHFEKGSTK